MSITPTADDSFAALRALVVERGLLRRQPLYYTWKITQIVLMFAAGVTLLIFSESIWIHLFAALFMAFVYAQIAMLMHDAGHMQIFTRARGNKVVGQLCALVLGGSIESWTYLHNLHHAHPNREDSDPDIAIPFFVYSELQAREAKNRNMLKRFIIRNQGVFYFPLLLVTALVMRANAAQFLIKRRKLFWRFWADWLGFFLNIVCYFALLFYVLPPLHAVLFFVIHQAVWGFYMGSIFAPNHKGMPIIAADSDIDYLREQVITSRNVRSHPVTDFLYGGLNYQIEHHLFPTMPRNKLRDANALVRDFCRNNDIPYYETSLARSYVEVVRSMHEIAVYFRGCPD